MTTRELLNWGAWRTILVQALFGFTLYLFKPDWLVWEPYAINYIIFGLLWVITDG